MSSDVTDSSQSQSSSPVANRTQRYEIFEDDNEEEEIRISNTRSLPVGTQHSVSTQNSDEVFREVSWFLIIF
jgi:hypothetical protein